MTIRSGAAGIYRKLGPFLVERKRSYLFKNQEFSHQFSKGRLKTPGHFLKATAVGSCVPVTSMGHYSCPLSSSLSQRLGHCPSLPFFLCCLPLSLCLCLSLSPPLNYCAPIIVQRITDGNDHLLLLWKQKGFKLKHGEFR